jgi:hypothetical protein
MVDSCFKSAFNAKHFAPPLRLGGGANKALAHWQISTLAQYLTPISAIYDELLAEQTNHWHISRLAD